MIIFKKLIIIFMISAENENFKEKYKISMYKISQNCATISLIVIFKR